MKPTFSLRSFDCSRLLVFEADWRRVLFLHFEIAPEFLAPCVPVPLELRDGKAYLSLVNFSFERLRFSGTGNVGRCLCRALSEHPFLNVRTYVRSAEGAGIFFIAEWINNPISLCVGPRSHGLPYRLGHFSAHTRLPGGISHLRVKDCSGHGSLRVTFPSSPATPLSTASAGSLEAFLLERYRAFTAREGVTRTFNVQHEPWRFTVADWVRLDLEMLLHAFPWFRHAHFIGGHVSPGVENVRMHAPEKIARARVEAETLAAQPIVAGTFG